MDSSRARLPRLSLSCLLLALVPSLLGAQAAEERAPASASPTQPETAPAAGPRGLPAGVAPVEGALAERIRTLTGKAEEVRGLKASHPILAGTLDEKALRERMADALSQDLSPQEAQAMELGLKAFGLIPESMNLARYLPELMTSQVAGYYDPERKYLALVRRPGVKKTLPGGNFDEDDFVILHELVHALQDQAFDLDKFQPHDPTSDEATARGALVEGDAMLAMILGMPGFDRSALSRMEPILDKLLENPALFQSADLPGGGALKEAPPFLRDSLLFSYLQGFRFAFLVQRAGGQMLLDYAYSTDPPRSSEQILHPEKWHADRDDPVTLKLPDLAAGLPQLPERSGGVMGEVGVQLLLREKLGDKARADRAAAGWAGDRFEVYAKGDDRRLVWLLDWDAERDADEFAAAARGLGRTWKVERLAPRRVAVLRGDWPKEEREALFPRLAALEASKPKNARIDFAAIGAAPPEVDPVEEPEEEQSESPEEPATMKGTVSEDGRSYRDEETGFSIRLPKKGNDWAFEMVGDRREQLISVTNRNLGAVVVAIEIGAETGAGPEAVAGLFESGLSPAVPGYQRLSGRKGKLGGRDSYELEFEGKPSSSALRGTVRVVSGGEGWLVFTATSSGASWKRLEAPLREILDSVELLPRGGEGQP